jgi:aryl-alcohol dehydrogenase-like predicted oxidoreductase
MFKRKLGYTDLELTVTGIGTWAIGGSDWRYGWGPQDDELSIRAIRRGLDLGINWIDTAPAYGNGHSEQIVGRAIKGLSPRPLIATKCGLAGDGKGGVRGYLKKNGILSEIEFSLKNLDIERIDILQIHWPIPDGDIEEAWRAIQIAIRQGKVRYAGVSNFNTAQLDRINKIAPAASLQPPYSMLKRDIEIDILPYCSAKNIGVIVYSPMQKGLLSGKMTANRVNSFPDNDHRKTDPLFIPPLLNKNLCLASSLADFAAKRGKTAGQAAIAWVLRKPEVTSAIAGIRNESQAEEIAKAGSWSLSEEELLEIDGIIKDNTF